jgi:hypothetical protein
MAVLGVYFEFFTPGLEFAGRADYPEDPPIGKLIGCDRDGYLYFFGRDDAGGKAFVKARLETQSTTRAIEPSPFR